MWFYYYYYINYANGKLDKIIDWINILKLKRTGLNISKIKREKLNLNKK